MIMIYCKYTQDRLDPDVWMLKVLVIIFIVIISRGERFDNVPYFSTDIIENPINPPLLHAYAK